MRGNGLGIEGFRPLPYRIDYMLPYSVSMPERLFFLLTIISLVDSIDLCFHRFYSIGSLETLIQASIGRAPCCTLSHPNPNEDSFLLSMR